MLQHGTWNQIWKLFCWGPMGQGSQDPGYGVAHSPLQLLRLQRRFGDFRTLGRSWRNHTLQLAHWLQTPRPGPTGHSAWLVTLGLSPRHRDPESGFDSSFYCGLFQSRDIFGWCRCGLLTDSLLRIRVSEKDAPAMPMPSNIDEDRCGSHEKPALLDQVPRNHAFSWVFYIFLYLYGRFPCDQLCDLFAPGVLLGHLCCLPCHLHLQEPLWGEVDQLPAMVPWCQGHHGHHGHHGHLEQISKSWEHNWMRLDLGIGCPLWVKISSDSKRVPTWPIHTHSILKNAAARRTRQRMSWPCSHPRHTHSELAVKLLR